MATRDQLSMEARIKIGKSLIDIEPSAILEFYELYYDSDSEPFRFHAGTNNLDKNIIWNGKEYYASAIEVEGFEVNIANRLPRPKITASNVDYILSNILRQFSDFRYAKFVRIKTFLKHIDEENFDDGINPFGVSDALSYISKETYLVSQKLVENKNLIQFELITPFDLQNLQTATRAIYGRYCFWQYRGSGCNYQGDLVCKEDDSDFSVSPDRSSGNYIRDEFGAFKNKTFESTIAQFKWNPKSNYNIGQIVFVENIDLNGLKDPPRTWFVCILSHNASEFITPNKSPFHWEKDGCSKTIAACQKRFKSLKYINSKGYSAFNDSEVNNGVMPFGGFPGTDKFSYE